VRFALAAFLFLVACGRTDLSTPADGGLPDGGPPDGGPADGGCSPASFTEACGAIQNSTWASLHPGECGLCSPGGTCACTWHVTFSDPNKWSWQHSDFGETGTYGCTGLTVNVRGAFPMDLQASYDPKCDQLSWDGVLYRRGQ